MKLSSLYEKATTFRLKYIKPRNFVLILSGIVGLAVGFSAVIIKNLVYYIKLLITSGFTHDVQNYLYFIFPLLGILLTMFFLRFILRQEIGPGIPSVLYAISKNNGIIKPHNLYSSIVTSALTVGFGGSVGLEGPTVATGGAIGSNLGRFMKLNYKETILLLACASAGAMSAIFKAPIAAIVFALEVIMVDLTIYSMIPLLIASTIAALTSYFFQGQNVLYPFEIQEAFQLGDIHLYILLGGIAGIGSVHFSRIYTKISGMFEKINSWFKRLLIAGSLLGLILFFLPSLYGEGYEEINMCLRGDYSYLFNNFLYDSLSDNTWAALGLMFLLVVFKSIATSLTFAAGGIGGIFAPSLFMGANMGLLAGLVLNMFGLNVSLSNFALVGMAGLVAGVIHAPLTAIFLIAELTGGHELFMPLMIVSTISYATVRIFEPHSLYTRQLAQRGELMTHHKDRNILLMMNVSELIEKDFTKVYINDKLGDLVKTIKKSKRNIFPVVDDDNRFMGIVKLDDIRHIMFETDMYDKTSVKDLMFMPENTIDTNEQMEQVAKKFQESGRFNIVVLQEGKYLGFVSRAKVFSSYREMLKQFSDE